MKSKSVITTTQMFILLFVSRITSNIAYTPMVSKTNNILDFTVSALISFVLTLVMLIPAYLISKKTHTLNLLDYSYEVMGKFGSIFAIVIGLYFLFTCVYSLTMFDVFVGNIASPELSLGVLSVAILVAAYYGATKGIEAIARTSGIIFVLILIAIVFISSALIPKIDPINFEPIMYNGVSSVTNGVLLMLSQSVCIPAIMMLLTYVKGNMKKGMLWWSVAIYASYMVVIVIIVGALGDYLKSQTFPVYSAASTAEIGVLKNLDSLYIGIWTSGLFIKITLFLYLFALCIEKLFGKKASKIVTFLGGIVIAAASTMMSEFKYIFSGLFNLNLLFIATLIVATILPTILLITDKFKHIRSMKYEN